MEALLNLQVYFPRGDHDIYGLSVDEHRTQKDTDDSVRDQHFEANMRGEILVYKTFGKT